MPSLVRRRASDPSYPARIRVARSHGPSVISSQLVAGPALLVAIEGLDAAGTADGVELVGRWLERKGWRVRFHASEPSPLVRDAARSPKARRALTPTVAALLAAADATRRTRAIAAGLGADAALVVDRYAWTAVARDAARGVPLVWAARLYAACPAPDLVVLVDHPPAEAVDVALEVRGPGRVDAVAAGAFASFLGRVAAAYDELAGATDSGHGVPWTAALARVPSSGGPQAVLGAVRASLGARARPDAEPAAEASA
jgi:thymidylate kinase